MIVANNTIRVWKEHTPAHWQVVPLKYVITYNEDKLSEQTDDDYEFDYVDIGSVTYGKGIENFQHMKFSDAPSRARRIVRSNDVIISTVRTYLKATAKIEEHDNPVIVSTGFMVMRARVGVILPDFLGYIAQSDGLVSEIECQSYGTSYPAINAGEIAGFSIPLPPLTEQSAIVCYLDAKCAAIDEAIERHKGIIEKLEEHRKASAFNAVTKGISHSTLKPSGEEWLGDIPEHWSVQRNWALFKEVNERGNDHLPILTVSINSGISDRELSDDESDRIFVRSADKSKYKRVQPGDIAYNMMRAWQGAFGTARVEGMVSPAYVTVRPIKKMDSRYYEYLMRSDSASQEFEKYSRGITDFRLRLYYPEFSNIKVCVPPLAEQKEIADRLDDLYKKTDIAVARANAIIAKLEEYRKSLIYNVVTGKIDCRTETQP